MLPKGLSLSALEVFEAAAHSGSVSEAAQRTGLSLPAASQKLRSLEEALGAPLLDRTTRPLQLTPTGRQVLVSAEAALHHVRRAQAGAKTGRLQGLSLLRLAVIDDFDVGVTPALVTALDQGLSDCRFSLTTAPSHAAVALADSGQVDVAIAAAPEPTPSGLSMITLMQDPFVLAVPAGTKPPRPGGFDSFSELPMLRFPGDQVIGQRVSAELNRHGLELSERFELDSNPAMLALIAAGRGWAITTALSVLRGQRFAPQIDIHPLPITPFSRTIGVFYRTGAAQSIAADIAQTMGEILTSRVSAPAQALMPWLTFEMRDATNVS